jgi:secreted trypsin-like serine protease
LVYIGGNKAMTAAHCTAGRAATAHRIGLGSHLLNGISTTIFATAKAEHPQYNGNAAGYPNDIATLTLASTPPSSATIQPIALATASDGTFAGTRAIISGWGRTTGGGSSPNQLQYVEMTVLTNTDCASRWSGVSGATVNAGHICIFETGKSACSGDSGGPMTTTAGNRVIGVTSWGISSCSGGYPSVYTRVSQYEPWVRAN